MNTPMTYTEAFKGIVPFLDPRRADISKEERVAAMEKVNDALAQMEVERRKTENNRLNAMIDARIEQRLRELGLVEAVEPPSGGKDDVVAA